MKTTVPFASALASLLACAPFVAACVALAALLPGCRRESARGQAARTEDALAPNEAVSSFAPTPPLPHHITHSASFAVPDVALRIEDIHMSKRLDDVLAKTSADVVVNGGFFGEGGEPVGLAVSDGQTLARFSSQMSGGVLWVRDGAAHLSSTEEYREAPVSFAIQCRPRLVVGSRVNIKSDDGRHAARTAICLRRGGEEIELVIAESVGGDGGPTLFQLATELLAAGCEDALNLDGGPSTGWAEAREGGASFRSPAAPVRHAIVVARRK